MRNDFEEQQTEIERLVNELEETTITLQNYKVFSEKVASSVQIIKAQLENLIREYKNLKEKYDVKVNSPNIKRSIDEGFMPKEVFELMEDMNTIFRNAYSWKLLEAKLYSSIFRKLFLLLDEAKALDIKREALAEMREMENKRNELFLESIKSNNRLVEEVINSRLSAFDDKFINSLKILVNQMNMERAQLLTAIVKNNDRIAIDGLKNELASLFAKSRKDLEEVLKRIEQPVHPVKLVDEVNQSIVKRVNGNKRVRGVAPGDEVADDDFFDDDELAGGGDE